MKKQSTAEQGSSLTEAIARLESALAVAQIEKNTQEILSLKRVIACFKKKLNLLKSLK